MDGAYLCTLQAWVLNLNKRFRMLEEVKVFGEVLFADHIQVNTGSVLSLPNFTDSSTYNIYTADRLSTENEPIILHARGNKVFGS